VIADRPDAPIPELKQPMEFTSVTVVKITKTDMSCNYSKAKISYK
jgi:hypothetical protein